MSALVLFSVLAAAPVEPISFTEAIERAIAQAPRMSQVRASVGRAEALVVQSRAAWLPTLSLNGTFTQLEGNRGLADRVLLPASSAGANLQLGFPLLAAPRWIATGQAELSVEAAKADEVEARRTLASVVGRAWLTVELQHKLLAVTERARKTSADQLELATLRQSGGLGTRLDLVRARRELADNEGRLARARADLALSQEVLGVLVGAPRPLDVSGEAQLPAVPRSEELDAAIDRRPDVRAAHTRTTLAARAVELSWTDYLPTAGLSVQPTAQTPPTPTQPALGLTAQVSGQLMLFDGLARSGQKQERVAALEIARSQEDEVRLKGQSELRLALEVLAHREVAASAASRSASLALEAEGLARAAWKEGASTNVELIEAERSARDAESLAEAARTSELSARLDALIAAARFP